MKIDCKFTAGLFALLLALTGCDDDDDDNAENPGDDSSTVDDDDSTIVPCGLGEAPGRARLFVRGDGRLTSHSTLYPDVIESSGVRGTAAVITPVGSITWGDRKAVYCEGDVPGPHCTKLYDKLTGIQLGEEEDTRGWIRKVP